MHVLVIRLSNLLVHAQGVILPVLRGQAVHGNKAKCSLVSRPLPAFQCCTLKSERAWYLKSRARAILLRNKRLEKADKTSHQLFAYGVLYSLSLYAFYSLRDHTTPVCHHYALVALLMRARVAQSSEHKITAGHRLISVHLSRLIAHFLFWSVIMS